MPQRTIALNRHLAWLKQLQGDMQAARQEAAAEKAASAKNLRWWGEEGGRGKLSILVENFAIFLRARSRLYQNEILQENNIQNMRSTAFFKLYKICILLHRCNLKIFAKNRFEKSAISVKIQQIFCKCRKIPIK